MRLRGLEQQGKCMHAVEHCRIIVSSSGHPGQRLMWDAVDVHPPRCLNSCTEALAEQFCKTQCFLQLHHREVCLVTVRECFCGMERHSFE